uniref:C-type lectin domain-containing protein n=1 Tax=Anas platyrhynchos platyrhynchos TaxID=8840 RepID=A0A493TNI5_ANAPP
MRANHLDNAFLMSVWKCCPEGWRPFQESCYYFSGDQMPWNESQQNCSGMGSQLVVINTKAEQVSAGLGEGQSSLETGVPGLGGPQSPSWLLFWRPGEPSNKPAEMCVVIYHNTENLWNWNDVPCTTRSYRICETAPLSCLCWVG